MGASRLLLAGVTGLAAAEVAARTLEPALPTHRLWYDTLPAVHLRTMRERRRAGGADVVFCGSSVVHCGLDPAAVLSAAGAPVAGYNASLHRGFYAIIGPWLERAVIPTLRPKVVVLGCSLVDLNDKGPLLRTEPRKYSSSLLGRDDAVGAAARRVEPWSALFRNHRVLRSPRTLVSAVGHRRRGTVVPDVDVRASRVTVGPNGEWTGFHGRGFLTTDAMWDHVVNGALGDYHVGGEQVAVVESTIRRLQRLVPLVVLTTVPLSSVVPSVLPDGQADIDASHEIIRDLGARTGAVVVEPRPALVDDVHFADIVHTNERGTAAFSASLGPLLRPHL